MNRKRSERSDIPTKVRIGFIGSGGAMNAHVERLKGTPSEIVAIMDSMPQAIAMLKNKQPQLAKVQDFSNWQTMLDESELDAVIIGSPHRVHYEQICAALGKGLHVLSEKPMACSSAHARELCILAKKSKKVLTISYQRHYQGGYRYMKQAVDSGRIGKVEFIAAFQAQEWLKHTKGTWRQKIALSGGGQINDSGSHLMDMLMWTTGLQAEEVSARMEFFGGEVDINSAISVKFSNGAIGTVSIIGNAPTWHEDLTIVGSEGAIYNRNGKISWQEGHKKPVYDVSKMEDWMDPDKNFIGAILGKCENGCPPEIGLRVIEITEAAWRSHAKHGVPVKVERG